MKDKVAIITGASGAFGAVAAEDAGFGGRKTRARRRQGEGARRNRRGMPAARRRGRGDRRPARSEAACDAIVAKAIARFGRLDILVVASGKNDVAKIVDMAPERFLDVMDANVTQSWLIARAAGKQMLAQGEGGKIILMSSARGLLGHPAGYTRLLRVEVGDRRHHASAGMRMGADRHHGQCDRADRVPLAAHRMDV